MNEGISINNILLNEEEKEQILANNSWELSRYFPYKLILEAK